MRIILVRHGETTWNIEGRYQGQEDTPLSERGLRQGHLLAEGLHHISIDVCISSPLQRSYQTCKLCADLHKLPLHLDLVCFLIFRLMLGASFNIFHKPGSFEFQIFEIRRNR